MSLRVAHWLRPPAPAPKPAVRSVRVELGPGRVGVLLFRRDEPEELYIATFDRVLRFRVIRDSDPDSLIRSRKAATTESRPPAGLDPHTMFKDFFRRLQKAVRRVEGPRPEPPPMTEAEQKAEMDRLERALRGM